MDDDPAITRSEGVYRTLRRRGYADLAIDRSTERRDGLAIRRVGSRSFVAGSTGVAR